MMNSLYTQITGSGDDLLVLLHGLGTTADIWSAFIAATPATWPGRILAIDLPGHGRSGRLNDYDPQAVAASVAAVVRGVLADSGYYRVLGHSYGGVVALALARTHLARMPDFVFGLGIKTVWTEAEVQGMRQLAHKPIRRFPDAAGALGWYLKVAGLAGLGVAPGECSARGVVEDEDGQWRLALDPRVNAITPSDMAGLTAGLRGRFSLAYGADDRMVDVEDLRRLDPAARSLDGGGHNIMVNNPRAVWDWLQAGD